MPLERAIHKLTGEPAAVYGLTDRGTVEVGKAADLCVFDPETVAPGPLRRVRDFPANGERLTADAPVGMTHTLVNGVPIRVDGAPGRGRSGGPARRGAAQLSATRQLLSLHAPGCVRHHRTQLRKGRHLVNASRATDSVRQPGLCRLCRRARP